MSDNLKTNGQLRTIWGLAKGCNLDADTLHVVVEGAVGVSSLKQLTKGQANEVIRLLKAEQKRQRQTRRQNKQRLGKETTHITPDQARYMKQLKHKLGWTEDRLNGFIKRQTGIERWEWLPPARAVGVIQALKEMAEREARK